MWEEKFSSRSKTMKASAIRELLKLVESPDIISFAGGMPDPNLFPKEILGEIAKEVFVNHGGKALQYGPTEGVKPLRETIVKMMQEEGIKNVGLENVLVTTASQQALDLIAKVFVDPGDTVIVEAPSYVGGLQALQAFQANFVTVPLDEEGIKTDILEEKIKELQGKGVNIKLIYVIPNFQNPAGVTLSLERRKELLRISHTYEIPIIEDDPYGEIRFEGEKFPSLLELDQIGNVIGLRTFSKILAPGFRLGWIIANATAISKLALAKQAADLCSPSSTQYIADKFIRDGYMNDYLDKVRKVYKEKKDTMLNAMEKYFPKEVTWTKPHGGMFVWVETPEYIDTDALFIEAVKEKKVAYVIGSAFYPYGEDKRHMRLNFTLSTLEQIDEGIKRLGELLQSKIR
ncbi:aminotransferase-like domain-containing protein [Caldisericum exile]|nr:PLP-dependent aminotransferase family protein [Caldisericum exile]